MSESHSTQENANQTMSYGVPADETPYQRYRQGLLLLFFVSLFLLSISVEIFSRDIDPAVLAEGIANAFLTVLDPAADPPSLDPLSNSLALLALLRNMLPAVLMLFLTLWLGALFLQVVHGIPTTREAFQYLSDSLFGKFRGKAPAINVAHGQIQGGEHQPLVRIGGPCKLNVANDSAVLLVHAGRLSRVVGPGSHMLRRFEKIREVIDLRPLSYVLEVQGFSREGIPVKCTVDIDYQINDEGSDSHPATDERPYPYSEKAVFVAATDQRIKEMGQADHQRWGDRLAGGEVEGALKNILAQYPVDRLIQSPPDTEGEESEGGPVSTPRQTIQKKLEADARANAAQHGARILKIALRNIELGVDGVSQQWIKTWQAEWEKRRRMFETRARAERVQRLTEVRNEARRETLQAIFDGVKMLEQGDELISPNLIKLQYVDTLERLAQDPRFLPLLLSRPERITEMFKSMREMVGSPDAGGDNDDSGDKEESPLLPS